MHDALPRLSNSDFPPLTRTDLDTLQVNLGYRCNQSCVHCHVNAGPTRKEEMDEETIGLVLEYIERTNAKTLDVTGGAPELNPRFRELVETATARGIQVI